MSLTKREILFIVGGLVVGVFVTLGVAAFILNGNPKTNSNTADRGDSSIETPKTTVTASPTAVVLPTVAAEAEPEGKVAAEATVKVLMFSNPKFIQPGATDYFTEFPRTTDRKDVGTFAVEQIIAGPSLSETASGHQPTFGEGRFGVIASEASNCGDKNFTLSINSDKLAIVKFCRGVTLTGDMSGSVITEQITRTLKQFPSIQKVAVLNKYGSCFNDMKGAETIQECAN